jgi:hypothetical protein
VKRQIIERVTTRDKADDFDREFWRKAGHEARWVAAHEMVIETELFRGRHAGEFRLQRTVESVQRRNG